MKNKWIYGVLAALLIGVGFWRYRVTQQSSAKKDLTTRTAQARLGTIQDAVEATGDVAPKNRVEIKPQVAGRIEQLLVQEGDHVEAGQILGWMSSTDRAAILDAARAQGAEELKKWQDAYRPTPIIAPLSGTIILRNVVVGQTVDTSLVIYAMSDKLIVVAAVDETDIGRIRLGMPAEITLDSYPNQVVNGSVFQILYEGQNVSNVITYSVKINPRNVPPFFRSQMTANIALIAAKKEKAVLVPVSAVRTSSTGDREVQVPGPKGKPVPLAVQTGLENGNEIEITDGLQAGDTVYIIGKRYTPQQASASSPLIMGGPRKSTGGSGGSGGAAH